MRLVFIFLSLKQFFFFILLLFIFGAWASLHGGLSLCRARAVGYGLSNCDTHRLRCSAACGIFLDQGLNLYPLHWQADSKPLDHEGSPKPLLMHIYGI